MSVSREAGLIVFIHRELSEGVSLIEILTDIHPEIDYQMI